MCKCLRECIGVKLLCIGKKLKKYGLECLDSNRFKNRKSCSQQIKERICQKYSFSLITNTCCRSAESEYKKLLSIYGLTPTKVDRLQGKKLLIDCEVWTFNVWWWEINKLNKIVSYTYSSFYDELIFPDIYKLSKRNWAWGNLIIILILIISQVIFALCLNCKSVIITEMVENYFQVLDDLLKNKK